MEVESSPLSRRAFIRQACVGTAALQAPVLWPTTADATARERATYAPAGNVEGGSASVPSNLIGGYGPWAASLAETPPKLSFRRDTWTDVEEWRAFARQRFMCRLAPPEVGDLPEVTVHRQYTYDGLHVEELSWQLPYGAPTKAVLLKPEGAKGPLPGLLGLHDHAGDKYFGRQKITKTAGIYNIAGFNDDTRAFLSIPARHDLSHRVDANYVAGLVARHQIDRAEARRMVRALAYDLARETYRLDTKAAAVQAADAR